MAYIVLTDGTTRIVKPNAAVAIWQVLNGETEPDEAMAKYCDHVARAYLNWRTAPENYLLKNKTVLTEMILLYFMVMPEGVPTQPEPGDSDLWRVSKILGLLDKNGKPTDYMNECIRKYYYREFMGSKPIESARMPYKD